MTPKIEIIEDFEHFSNTRAMLINVSHTMKETSSDVEYDTGINESNSMILVLNTSQDPWYTQLELDIDPVKLSDVDAVLVHFKQMPGSSDEQLEVQLKTAHGELVVKGERTTTQTFSKRRFEAYEINTAMLNDKSFSRISINAASSDGGTAYLAVDDISIRHK